MLCPNCNSTLEETEGRSQNDLLMKLDQCPKCGGVWFDKWELFNISKEEVKKLGNKDSGVFDKKGACPVCGAFLVSLKDLNVPPEIEMNSCLGCGGFWMNPREALEYKEYQEERMKKREEEIAEQAKKKRIPEKTLLSRLGNFFSTPIDKMSLMPIPRQDVSADRMVGLTANLAADTLPQF